MNFEPIPTRYDGHDFRSKLESLWAALFNRLGVDYLYEHQYFSTPVGGYLPDFYIPSKKLWLEVKPDMPSAMEAKKLKAVQDKTGETSLFLCGFPALLGKSEAPAWIANLNGRTYSIWKLLDSRPQFDQLLFFRALSEAQEEISNAAEF